MALLAIDDLFAAETRETVLQDILDVADDVTLKVTSWQPGQPIRSILTYISQKIADNTARDRLAIRGGLLDYAEEGWLTLLAQSVYRVTRQPATFATGDSLSVTNGGTSIQTFQTGDLIVAHDVTGKTYTNRALIVVNPGATVTDNVIDADEVGSASNAGPGLITTLVTTFPDITVTNVRAVLGADEEDDPHLRTRCRAKLGSLSPNGPKEAYDFVVTTQFFEDGTPCCPTSVPIRRSQVVLDTDNGALTVYTATDAGAPIAGDVDIATDSIHTWSEPWLVDSAAAAATEDILNVTYTAWVRGSNLTVDAIKSKISTALAVFLKSYPIGGEVIPPDVNGILYVNTIEAVITKAVDGVIKISVTLPAADQAVIQGHTVVLGTVTGTIVTVT